VPVFIDQKLYNKYYNGFGNDLLWPLLHYETGRTIYREDDWAAYEKVNQIFCDKVLEVAKSGDVIWIQDFHLFLLPELLKKKNPSLKLGFFLHVPFPSSEIFRQLPHREEILRSVLHADLIGFHDYSYLRHFCSSALRILGLDTSELEINISGHTARLGVFPVSIDTQMVVQKSKLATTEAYAKKFKSDRFTFLGVDRLDYTKGIELKLLAFKQLLKKYPEFRKKVRLIQVAIPTRSEVPEYQALKQQIEQMVGEINGEFATFNWVPVRYIYNTVALGPLIGLYRASDALLVTSKRDGMNLVALEYVASQNEKSPGMVLLSEFAGALSLLNQTLPLNPWNADETADRMQEALKMPRQERQNRWKQMSNFLNKYTATDWARSFMNQLQLEKGGFRPGPAKLEVSKSSIQMIKEHIDRKGKETLHIFIDYDGTLVPIQDAPEKAIIDPSILELLKKLNGKNREITIVSGRSADFLAKQFENSGIRLVAEHGARVFEPSKKRWEQRITTGRQHWYTTALKIMNDYALRVQGSHVEKKSYSIAWHYRQAQPEYSLYQSLKLQEELELVLSNEPTTILRGKKVLEVRSVEANKGFYISHYLDALEHPAASIAIGDDATDEDMFAALKGRGLSIKVGKGATAADYYLSDQKDVIPFIKLLKKELAL